jgi:carboxypeptidase C (cathepsin A)
MSDLVSQLPGLYFEFPSRHYSGFVPVKARDNSASTQMHYYYAESQRSAEDPLVVWLQGGPGSSSLGGAFIEMGPFSLDERSYDKRFNETGVPTVLQNNFTWNAFAHMLFPEQPGGVGFSTCNNLLNASAACTWNDQRCAEFNHDFLLGFFQRYPNLRANPLYIAGESYGGIFVTTLAKLLSTEQDVNLAGIMVGNGAAGHFSAPVQHPRVYADLGLGNSHDQPNDPLHHVEFYRGSGMLSADLYTQLTNGSACPDLNDPGAACIPLLKEMLAEVGKPGKMWVPANVYDMCTNAPDGGDDDDDGDGDDGSGGGGGDGGGDSGAARVQTQAQKWRALTFDPLHQATTGGLGFSDLPPSAPPCAGE